MRSCQKSPELYMQLPVVNVPVMPAEERVEFVLNNINIR